MNNWIFLTFAHAVFAGLYQTSNKKAIENNNVFEILGIFSLFAVLFAALVSRNVFDIDLINLLYIFIKSLVIVLMLILNLYAVKNVSLGKYGIIHMSRVVFTILLSVLILKEKLTLSIILGIIIVLFGLYMANGTTKEVKRVNTFKYDVILLFSCFLNSVSAILDKLLLIRVTDSQLQFWYILFIALIYWIIILIKKQDIDIKKIKKNYWIIIMAFMLTVGDKLLFIANAIPESQVSVITIIKQFSAIEVILLGKVLYKEKKITQKILWSLVVIVGIITTIM